MPRRKLRGTVLYWRAQAELPIPEMRELAVWRMLRALLILGTEKSALHPRSIFFVTLATDPSVAMRSYATVREYPAHEDRRCQRTGDRPMAD